MSPGLCWDLQGFACFAVFFCLLMKVFCLLSFLFLTVNSYALLPSKRLSGLVPRFGLVLSFFLVFWFLFPPIVVQVFPIVLFCAFFFLFCMPWPFSPFPWLSCPCTSRCFSTHPRIALASRLFISAYSVSCPFICIPTFSFSQLAVRLPAESRLYFHFPKLHHHQTCTCSLSLTALLALLLFLFVASFEAKSFSLFLAVNRPLVSRPCRLDGFTSRFFGTRSNCLSISFFLLHSLSLSPFPCRSILYLYLGFVISSLLTYSCSSRLPLHSLFFLRVRAIYLSSNKAHFHH